MPLYSGEIQSYDLECKNYATDANKSSTKIQSPLELRSSAMQETRKGHLWRLVVSIFVPSRSDAYRSGWNTTNPSCIRYTTGSLNLLRSQITSPFLLAYPYLEALSALAAS